MNLIEHPESFKTGVRLVMRVWRNKENESGRRPGRTLISRDPPTWQGATGMLIEECIPGERVYASAEARDIEKAIRIFKERQLAADYDQPFVRHAFYNDCGTRWLSCLGAPQASAETLFMFDCDDKGRAMLLREELKACGVAVVHSYPTKNGGHILTLPFNPAVLSDRSRSLLHKNALILVAWS